MNTCQAWRAAIITSLPCTFLSFITILQYPNCPRRRSARQRGKRRRICGIRSTRPREYHRGGRKEARAARFETHGRITSGVPVHGAEHDAYILIAVIHRVGWPTSSAALWVCPWEMAKTTCKESPRNKTTFGHPAYPLTSRRRCSMQIHGMLVASSPFSYPFF